MKRIVFKKEPNDTVTWDNNESSYNDDKNSNSSQEKKEEDDNPYINNPNVRTNIYGKSKAELIYDISSRLFIRESSFTSKYSVSCGVKLYNTLLSGNVIVEYDSNNLDKHINNNDDDEFID